MPHSDDWLPLLKALADPTRLDIIHQLLNGEGIVEVLATRINASSYNISKNLRVLREAGIVVSSRQGRHRSSVIAPEFRKRISRGRVLNPDCCTFHFDQ